MDQDIKDFFFDFRQEISAGSQVNNDFQLAEFMEIFTVNLTDTGVVDGFEFCHYRAHRGMRVDGYWFQDEDNISTLNLFIADFKSRTELESLTQSEVTTFFKRLSNFFEASFSKRFYENLEETSPEYGLSRQISDRKNIIKSVNFFIISERSLSDRFKSIENSEIANLPATYDIWDISRLQRMKSSTGQKEALDIDLVEAFGEGVPCLSAHLRTSTYKSYLIVMPAKILSQLYKKHGSRLLEQNVRSFLQARGKVNKGIRTTLLNEPEMFFAYNNGITATAQNIEFSSTDSSIITRIRDLQIVNGGQTTASLFHTERKDKISLENVFVQMKLSIIAPEDSEIIVPKISEYANTQNKVNAADFFANHAFHIRMEEFSRRIWAPAQKGSQKETKWFYERARGQYADAISLKTPADQRRWKALNPKNQMFTKTDLAKFENVWDEHPRFVNMGAQRNFTEYAKRIGKEWVSFSDIFNEVYFKRAISRAIIFRRTEKLVTDQPWYLGGYRANIVAYAIAMIRECCKQKNKTIDFARIWKSQILYPSLISALTLSAKFVSDSISSPPEGISNIGEWCKKEGCWYSLTLILPNLMQEIPEEFWENAVSDEEYKQQEKSAKIIQKIDNGILAQKKVLEINADDWKQIAAIGLEKKIFTQKECGIIGIAIQIPKKIPSEKQSLILIDVLNKIKDEGFCF